MDSSGELASRRSMSSQLVASQAVPTRTCFKRRSCDAALMLNCVVPESQMMSSSIEGILWSDDEEKQYVDEENTSICSQGESIEEVINIWENFNIKIFIYILLNIHLATEAKRKSSRTPKPVCFS